MLAVSRETAPTFPKISTPVSNSIEAHYRLLERLYLAAPINGYYRPTITIGDGTCDIGIEARKEMYHAAAAIHGSIYFKMLDDAAFFAVNSLVPDYFVLTASFHLYMIRPMSAGPIRSSGRIIRHSPA